MPDMRTFHLTEQDLIHAQRLHAVPSPRTRMIVSTIFVLVLVYYAQTDQITSPVLIGTVLGLTVWILLQFLVFIPSEARKVWASTPSLREQRAFEWNAQRLSVRDPAGLHELVWSRVLLIKDSPSMVLVYESTARFHALPRRCFDGESDFLAFKSAAAAGQQR